MPLPLNREEILSRYTAGTRHALDIHLARLKLYQLQSALMCSASCRGDSYKSACEADSGVLDGFERGFGLLVFLRITFRSHPKELEEHTGICRDEMKYLRGVVA